MVEKPPRNSSGFCGGGQGLSWAVEPRKEEEEDDDDCFRIMYFVQRRHQNGMSDCRLEIRKIQILTSL
jgi:hypothetical protein